MIDLKSNRGTLGIVPRLRDPDPRLMPVPHRHSPLKLLSALNAAFALLILCFVANADSLAEDLFRQGREEMKAGRYAEDCEHFREGYKVHPGNAALLNLAMCEEALGDIARAWTHFRACLEQLSEDDARRAIAEERFSAVERRVAMLTLALRPGVPRPVKVRVDDEQLGEAEIGIALPLDPGFHEIAVVPAFGPPARIAIVLREGERAVRAIEPPSAPATEPARVPAQSKEPGSVGQPNEEKDGSSGRVIGYAVGGAGVVLLAAAGVMSVLILDKQAIVRAHCPDKKCDDAGYRAGEQGRTLVTGAIAAGVLGTAVVGFGVYLLMTDGSSIAPARSTRRMTRKQSIGLRSREDGSRAPRRQTGVTLGPLLGGNAHGKRFTMVGRSLNRVVLTAVLIFVELACSTFDGLEHAESDASGSPIKPRFRAAPPVDVVALAA